MIGGYIRRSGNYGSWFNWLLRPSRSSSAIVFTGPTVAAIGDVAGGAGDISPTLPAGNTANRILICLAETDANQSVDPAQDMPAGWAHVTGSPVTNATGPAAQQLTLNVLWKRADGEEADPVVITETSGDRAHTVARILGVDGCITTGNPWDIVDDATADSTTTHSIPGGTTTVAQCLILAILGNTRNVNSTTNLSDWANGDLVNVTERIDNTILVGTGNGGGFGAASGEKATAGAFGATTVTSVTATNGAYLVMALKPPA